MKNITANLFVNETFIGILSVNALECYAKRMFADFVSGKFVDYWDKSDIKFFVTKIVVLSDYNATHNDFISIDTNVKFEKKEY